MAQCLNIGFLPNQRNKANADYQEVWFQLQPHLQHLWRNLTLAEQTTLRQTVADEDVSASANLLAALARRGIATDQRQPFSHLFADMIRSGQLET